MKQFLKVFATTTALLSIVVGVSAYAYMNYQGGASKEHTIEEQKVEEFGEEIKDTMGEERINILFLGVDGARADTIIFGTYDLSDKKVDLISIPRDTYCDNNYYKAQMKKINAIYPTEGLQGMVEATEEILGIEGKINYYVKIDYDGVKNIVDSVGGVEVEVPFDMVYRDPHSRPPLNINIRRGIQNLKGQKAVDFLRYRTNNDYTQGYTEGDLGRIEAQQQFVSSFIDKAVGIRLPSVIKTSLEEVETNIDIKDALNYAKSIVGLSGENMQLQTLPGEARYETVNGDKLSYFFKDDSELELIMSRIFEDDFEKEDQQQYTEEDRELDIYDSEI